jgi:excisionase family DNA binding protein
MTEQLMTTREVAAYLSMNEKQVYVLLRRHVIPGTRITGKWLFPKRLIDTWVEQHARSSVTRPGAWAETATVVLAGSDEPLLAPLCRLVQRQHPDLLVSLANVGSVGGLKALARGAAHIAGCHLWDARSQAYNLPFLGKYLPGVAVVVVNLIHRQQGLVVARGNPKRVAGLADIARAEIRFINRPAGTGTRLLLDQALQESGINPFDVQGYGEEVGTHLEVGIAVLTDRADAGLATLSIAHLLGLDFVPLRDERYDLVIPESLFFEPGVQTVLEVLRSKPFAEEIERSGGYQSQETGRVLARLTS